MVREKGSAKGYVAIYTSKNSDGYAQDGETDDASGRPLMESAQCATAWASRGGIFQFQFIGCVPVTVWRQLRRLDDSETAHGLSVQFATCHNAANAPGWADYVNAQGGPLVKCANLMVRNCTSQPRYLINTARKCSVSLAFSLQKLLGLADPDLSSAVKDCAEVSR
ncbi:MAG: hypothetical protein ACMX3H_03230 [Sodalis sp. (in: enterobacteria)]|uniref:hypothetical protein n=1 Tax=Sodalis sp. (in: enterobacteria) TaxID=1898979 RepID=UPI0039E4205D